MLFNLILCSAQDSNLAFTSRWCHTPTSGAPLPQRWWQCGTDGSTALMAIQWLPEAALWWRKPLVAPQQLLHNSQQVFRNALPITSTESKAPPARSTCSATAVHTNSLMMQGASRSQLTEQTTHEHAQLPPHNMHVSRVHPLGVIMCITGNAHRTKNCCPLRVQCVYLGHMQAADTSRKSLRVQCSATERVHSQ
jgi:hypothetical protein